MNPFDILSFIMSLGEYGGGAQRFLSAIDGLLSSLGVVYIFLILAIWITWYIFGGLTLLQIGRKTGLNNNEWMVFVPFARTIYRLNILDEQWWKMFFLEGYLVYTGLLIWIFAALGLAQGAGIMVLMLILLAYSLGFLSYNIYYMMYYYKAFNMSPLLAFLLNPLFLWMIPVIDIVIAYTSLFVYGGGCYANQAEASPVQEDSPAVPPASVSSDYTGNIRGIDGMYAGQAFTLKADEEHIIGRDAAVSHIIITDNAAKVSRKHCGILYDPQSDHYIVKDYSTNGTFTDRNTRLTANHPTPLPRGSVIYLGNQDNSFMLD